MKNLFWKVQDKLTPAKKIIVTILPEDPARSKRCINQTWEFKSLLQTLYFSSLELVCPAPARRWDVHTITFSFIKIKTLN